MTRDLASSTFELIACKGELFGMDSSCKRARIQAGIIGPSDSIYRLIGLFWFPRAKSELIDAPGCTQHDPELITEPKRAATSL